MVKKVNTKSNELKKKTRKVIKKTNVKEVKGGSKDSRNFATRFNNLVNLYYLLQMVLNIRKYNNIMAIPNFNKMNEKEKIDNVSEKLKEIILSETTYRFARKKEEQLNIFAESIKENLTNTKFGRTKKSGSVEIDAFINIRIRYIKDKIIWFINKGDSRIFNFKYSIFRKNLKKNKNDDEYRIEEDFISDLFLGDIHFYLRNTSTSVRDFTDKESVFVDNRSKYRLKSIDFNIINDDKTKLRIFYTMLKFIFYEDNLRKLINCPSELNFFMYNDNKVMNLSINKSQLYDWNKSCNENQENDNATIQKYINDKMPIFNSINDEKDYRVTILYNKYLKYIKETNNALCISSFLEFIGYKFSKLPELIENNGKEERKKEIKEALDNIFNIFINTYLSDINNVSSINKELTFSELSRELNILHDKIFLLDDLKVSDYSKSYFYNTSEKEKFVNQYSKFIMEIYNKFFKDQKECNEEIKEESEKEFKKKLKNHIKYYVNGEKYQKILLRSLFINNIRNIKTDEEHEKYFTDLSKDLENILANFNKVKKTGRFNNNNKDKEKIFNLFKKTKDALDKFSNCKKFYKIIIDIDTPTILPEDYDNIMLQVITDKLSEEGIAPGGNSENILKKIKNLEGLKIYTNISRIVYFNNSSVKSIPNFFNDNPEFVNFVIKTINIIYSNCTVIEELILVYLFNFLTYNIKEENKRFIEEDETYKKLDEYIKNLKRQPVRRQNNSSSRHPNMALLPPISSSSSSSSSSSIPPSPLVPPVPQSQDSLDNYNSLQRRQDSSRIPHRMSLLQPDSSSVSSGSLPQSHNSFGEHFSPIRHSNMQQQRQGSYTHYGAPAAIVSSTPSRAVRRSQDSSIASGSSRQSQGHQAAFGAFGASLESRPLHIATGGKDKNKKKLTQKEKAKKAKEKEKEKAKREKAKEKAKMEKAKEKTKKEKAKEKTKKEKAKEKAKKEKAKEKAKKAKKVTKKK